MSSQKAFRQVLVRIAGDSGGSLGTRQATAVFRKALLQFGSETDDNKSCAAKISVGTYRDKDRGCRVTGLALQPQRQLVSEILNQAEGAPIPSAVRKRFRGITQSEWDAILRLATLVFLSLERDR